MFATAVVDTIESEFLCDGWEVCDVERTNWRWEDFAKFGASDKSEPLMTRALKWLNLRVAFGYLNSDDTVCRQCGRLTFEEFSAKLIDWRD